MIGKVFGWALLRSLNDELRVLGKLLGVQVLARLKILPGKLLINCWSRAHTFIITKVDRNEADAELVKQSLLVAFRAWDFWTL